MQGQMIVRCMQCGKWLARRGFDTADTAEQGEKILEQSQQVLLEHRRECKFYRRSLLDALDKIK